MGKDEHHCKPYLVYENYVFTEDEKPLFEVTKYEDFDTLWKDIDTHKYGNIKMLTNKTSVLKKKIIEVFSVTDDFDISGSDFKNNFIAIRTDYSECSATNHNLKFFMNSRRFYRSRVGNAHLTFAFIN